MADGDYTETGFDDNFAFKLDRMVCNTSTYVLIMILTGKLISLT